MGENAPELARQSAYEWGIVYEKDGTGRISATLDLEDMRFKR